MLPGIGISPGRTELHASAAEQLSASPDGSVPTQRATPAPFGGVEGARHSLGHMLEDLECHLLVW